MNLSLFWEELRTLNLSFIKDKLITILYLSVQLSLLKWTYISTQDKYTVTAN